MRRRLELTRKVAVAEHDPGSPELGIDVARSGDAERLHPAKQRIAIARLDDHVNVGALDAQMNDVKRATQLA